MNDALGPCCGCGTLVGVNAIVMIKRRCAVPGHGWGCFECGLPRDGACLVLCNACEDRFNQDPDCITVACRGYPADEGRIPIAELPEGEFDHDMTKHRERTRFGLDTGNFILACTQGVATDEEKIAALIACCREYHDALDRCFAMLATLTGPGRPEKPEPFFPSRSPMWMAILAGKAVIDAIERGTMQ